MIKNEINHLYLKSYKCLKTLRLNISKATFDLCALFPDAASLTFKLIKYFSRF